jgi:hypothetical protein
MEVFIPADRLMHKFLAGRQDWQKRLDAFNESDSFESSGGSSYKTVKIVDPFAQLKTEMNFLLDNISPPPPISFVSRQLFTILFIRKMPQDVCWYIFDFFMDTKAMRKLLEKFATATPDTADDFYWSEKSPSLRSHRGEFAMLGVNRACAFILKNKENISTIDVAPVPAVPEFEPLDSRHGSTFMRDSNSISIVVADEQHEDAGMGNRRANNSPQADSLWTCSACTYLNTDFHTGSISRCEMCGRAKDGGMDSLL